MHEASADRHDPGYTVYILRCSGDRLYTGITTDLERRFFEHCGSEKGARFTRAFPPDTVAAAWKTDTRSHALQLEARIKRLKRAQKDALIVDNGLSVFGNSIDSDAYRRIL